MVGVMVGQLVVTTAAMMAANWVGSSVQRSAVNSAALLVDPSADNSVDVTVVQWAVH